MTDISGYFSSVLVHGERSSIARVFGRLVDLQPIRWVDEGLVCAPFLNPDRHPDDLSTCPLPVSQIDTEPIRMDTVARFLAGWYRRTPDHAPAPQGVRELVQAPGEGFGPHDHPTTTMCLRAIDGVPDGRAVDVGCGSGLLSMAWVTSGRGPCLGLDADPRAIDHARTSANVAGLASPDLDLHVGRIESLDLSDVATTTVIANLPMVAHELLITRLRHAPRTVILSGVSRRQMRDLLYRYSSVGLRCVRMQVAGRYACATLVAR